MYKSVRLILARNKDSLVRGLIFITFGIFFDHVLGFLYQDSPDDSVNLTYLPKGVNPTVEDRPWFIDDELSDELIGAPSVPKQSDTPLLERSKTYYSSLLAKDSDRPSLGMGFLASRSPFDRSVEVPEVVSGLSAIGRETAPDDFFIEGNLSKSAAFQEVFGSVPSFAAVSKLGGSENSLPALSSKPHFPNQQNSKQQKDSGNVDDGLTGSQGIGAGSKPSNWVNPNSTQTQLQDFSQPISSPDEPVADSLIQWRFAKLWQLPVNDSENGENEATKAVKDTPKDGKSKTAKSVENAPKDSNNETDKAVEDAPEEGDDETAEAIKDTPEEGGNKTDEAVEDTSEDSNNETDKTVEDTPKSDSNNETAEAVEDALEEGNDETAEAVEDTPEEGNDWIANAVEDTSEDGSHWLLWDAPEDLASPLLYAAYMYATYSGLTAETLELSTYPDFLVYLSADSIFTEEEWHHYIVKKLSLTHHESKDVKFDTFRILTLHTKYTNGDKSISTSSQVSIPDVQPVWAYLVFFIGTSSLFLKLRKQPQ